ncbi:alpha/beta hydrolase family protein [Actinomycetes bacterium M1A6_2h]
MSEFYGRHSDQYGDLRTPSGPGPHPIVVLVHGGSWRSQYRSDMLNDAARDLTARGYATWNVEYRCPDRYDWAATTSDVAAAIAHAQTLANTDRDRIAVIGHSAGGQLAMRAVADSPDAIAVAVTLAGVLDLIEADRRSVDDGSVSDALGGRYIDIPEVYHRSSPRHRLPVGVDQIVACASDDELLPMSRDYAAAAAAQGDSVEFIEGDGDHFAVVDPSTQIWKDMVGALDRRMKG